MTLAFFTRFEDAYTEEPNSGCWLWAGAGRGAENTYGVFRGEAAHRVSWRRVHGAIPPGLCVLHRCDVPACVNPDHLFLGTRGDNNRDMVAKGRHRAGGRGALPPRWDAIRPLAKSLGVGNFALCKWLARGRVPHRWRFPILTEAGKRGVLLTYDDMDWPASATGEAA